MERLTEFKELDDLLFDQERNIFGERDVAQDSFVDSINQSQLEDESLLQIKKSIISSINKLVNQFNENNKLIKD